MTTNLRSKIDVQLGWSWRDRIGPFTVIDDNRLAFRRELSDGIAAWQADVVWHAADQRLLAGQSTTFRLAALRQTLFGESVPIPLAKVKAILVVHKGSTGDAWLLVGGAGVDEWSAPFGMLGDTAKVMPGSPLLLANVREGWEVEPGYDALKLEAVGGDVVFDIAILGTSRSDAESPSS